MEDEIPPERLEQAPVEQAPLESNSAPSEPRPQRERRDESPREEGTVYIGKKPTMSYVLAVVTHFNNGLPEVKVKARGRSISQAVDVTQIVKNRFVPTMLISNVDITTEELPREDGSMSRVSSILISMKK